MGIILLGYVERNEDYFHSVAVNRNYSILLYFRFLIWFKPNFCVLDYDIKLL